MKQIKIITSGVILEAELNNSPTADLIYECLPLEGFTKCWGKEIYFEIPVKAKLEPYARTEMEIGEIAYWPPGKALCIFFGPTPASTGNNPVAASPVNPIGKILGNIADLNEISSGEKIKIEKN